MQEKFCFYKVEFTTKFLKIDELDKFEAERYTQNDWYFTGYN